MLDLPGLEQSADPALLRQKSRDFYWYSPLLKAALDGKRADLWVRPRDEVEVLAVLAACRAARLPVTVRGQNRQNDSPRRLDAGSTGVATRTWWPRLCSMKKCM